MTLIDAGVPPSVVDRTINAGLAGVDVADIYDGNDPEVVDPGPVEGGGPIVAPPSMVVESRTMWLESMDGATTIVLEGVEEFVLPGATGLNLPPVDVVTSVTPGMPGSSLQEINVLQREVFLPLFFASDVSQEQFFQKLDVLRGMVSGWDDLEIGTTGTFRLGMASSRGERVLDVVYVNGWSGSLGGDDSGTNWERFGLTLLAVDPYWRARTPVELSFARPVGDPFLGSGSGATPWPRRLTPSVVIGAGMQVIVEGDVPVWPEVELRGPALTASVSYPGTDINVPAGVPNTAALVLKTDPRTRSARLGGVIAWSRISMGSTFSPLRPGYNVINVLLSASSQDAGLVIRYVPGFKAAY